MLYLIYGEETYFIRETKKNLINNFFANISENNRVTYNFDYEKDSLNELISKMDQIDFILNTKIVFILENCSFLSSNTNYKKNKKTLDEFYKSLGFLKDDPNYLIIFVLFEKEILKSDFSSFFNKENTYCFLEISKAKRPIYIENYFTKNGYSIEKKAIDLLIEKVDYNFESFANESKKLLLYCDNKNITLKDVEEVVSTNINNNIFRLANAILDGDANKIYNIYKELKALNIEPVTLIALLTTNFTFLDEVYYLYENNCDANTISKILGANFYRVKISLNNKDKINTKIIKNYLNELYTLDKKIKLSEIDRYLGFEIFLSKIKKHLII